MTGGARLRLAVDCATPHLAVALVDERGTVVATSTKEVGRLHAALMTVALTELFAQAGAARSTVAEVRVGIGPGSYTGVRVAIAAAKGLGRAWNVPVLGVYSLLAQVGSELAVGEKGLVTVDARRGNVYAQPCTLQAGEAGAAATVVSLGQPHKVQLDALAVHYPGWRHLPSRPPDAAVLAATDDTCPAEPLYL